MRGCARALAAAAAAAASSPRPHAARKHATRNTTHAKKPAPLKPTAVESSSHGLLLLSAVAWAAPASARVMAGLGLRARAHAIEMAEARSI